MLDGSLDDDPKSESQIEQIPEYTDLVLLTAGGNDADFVGVVSACLMPYISFVNSDGGDPVLCRTRLENAQAELAKNRDENDIYGQCDAHCGAYSDGDSFHIAFPGGFSQCFPVTRYRRIRVPLLRYRVGDRSRHQHVTISFWS
jgi:hypothetical protein